MRTETTYLDADHDIVPEREAALVVTAELDDDGELISETWERMVPVPLTAVERRAEALRIGGPALGGVALLLAAIGAALAGASAGLSAGLAALGLAGVAWSAIRLLG